MAGTPVALTRLPTCETKGGLHCGGIREFLIKESRLRKDERSKRARFFSAVSALWFAVSALWFAASALWFAASTALSLAAASCFAAAASCFAAAASCLAAAAA
mmetsp:Transcript_24713/g.62007  ORF Transcript_24713/g.62007 Transcript_24713/m.62007 type:complete len:103 (+) Transcript_24713:866-1174(+)